MNAHKSHYRPDIDGLRAISIIAVVAFHFNVSLFSGGFVGVDIFFVISGFLIFRVIDKEINAGTFTFSEFYVRRARRILPALFGVIVASCALAFFVMNGREFNDFSKSVVANLTGLSNVYFWKSADYFSPSGELKPLMMTWSLSVEEQFYFFFPVVLLVLKRYRLNKLVWLLALSAASFIGSLILLKKSPSAAFFLLPPRAWELGMGALLAIAVDAPRLNGLTAARRKLLDECASVLGIVLIATAVLAFDGNTAFPGIAVLLPIGGAMLLILSEHSFFNRHILSSRPLVFIGLISYSLYLWHWPVLSFSRLVSIDALTPWTYVALAAISVVLATFSWRYIEKPFRGSSTGRFPTLWKYGAVNAALVGMAALFIFTAPLYGRLPERMAKLENATVRIDERCLAVAGTTEPIASPVCIPAMGDRKGLAVLGDSHAAAIAPAFAKLAERSGLAFWRMTKASCPMLAGVSRTLPGAPAHAEQCARFNRNALDLVVQSPAITTVVIAGYWSAPFLGQGDGKVYVSDGKFDQRLTHRQSADNLAAGLNNLVSMLTSHGKKVILVKDVPVFSVNMLQMLSTDLIPARRAIAVALGGARDTSEFYVPEHLIKNRGELSIAMIDAIGRHPDVVVLDPWAALCNQAGCRVTEDDKLYYFDESHLSEFGAHAAIKAFPAEAIRSM